MGKTVTRKRTAPKGILKSIGQRLEEKKSIDVLSKDNKTSLHHIDRRKVTMQKGIEGDAGTVGSSMVPSSDQLQKINQFTQIEATVDNVVAFGTNAMNDMYDRDDEKFTTETVKAFAKLPQPFSPIGKSYMVDHEYKMANAKGRIFDVGTKKIDGNLFLTPEVYVPKTAQFAEFIESIDFGINNFVSVGVVIDKNACSICKEPVYTSSWGGWSWCASGHEKGYYYVPGAEEDDGWGWYLPVDPSTKGAVKAQVDMFDPVDFYELSQVFLGAQYYAELAKTPGFKGIVKAASAAPVPVIGLSAKESSQFEMPHINDKLIEARKLYTVDTSKDGSSRWTDKAGLVWTYDPTDDEVSCLGKSSQLPDKAKELDLDTKLETLRQRAVDLSESVETFDAEGADDDEDPVAVMEALDATLDEASEALDNGEFDQADDLINAAEIVADQLLELLGGEDADDIDAGDPGSVAASAKSAKKKATKTEDEDDEDEDEEDEDVEDEEDETEPPEPTEESKTILVAARAAKLPTDILTAWNDNTLKGLLGLVAKELRENRKKVKEMEPKAAIADLAVKDAETEAIHWYAVSRRDPKAPNKGANVDLAQKLVARCDGDIELIKELGKEWRDDARKLFPKVARSTFEADANERKGTSDLPEEINEKSQDDTVQRLHSK